jgi:hypothetical protein
MPNAPNKEKDAKTKNEDKRCPSILVKKGNSLLLFNKNAPVKDGENPLPFFSLDEYIQYVEIQRKNGINCPILFLQQEEDTQGNSVYRVRPSPFKMDGGLPVGSPPEGTEYKNDKNGKLEIVNYIDASRENPPYNTNMYPGFDPMGLDIGKFNELDKIHVSTNTENSDNPMDTNWGGIYVTQKAIQSGKYEENNVTKPMLYNPQLAFNPSVPSKFAGPTDVI